MASQVQSLLAQGWSATGAPTSRPCNFARITLCVVERIKKIRLHDPLVPSGFNRALEIRNQTLGHGIAQTFRWADMVEVLKRVDRELGGAPLCLDSGILAVLVLIPRRQHKAAG